MSRNGLGVFDKTLQETHQWLRAMMEELETDNRRIAFSALRAMLHTLRDRIGPANAVHLGAQLPMLLRGAYYEGWRLVGTPTHERLFEDFLDHVAANLPDTMPVDAGEVSRAGFAVLADMLDAGEFEKLIQLLPAEIRMLRPEATVTEAFLPF
jgi:uncharacterized protein (DUF2267 family)